MLLPNSTLSVDARGEHEHLNSMTDSKDISLIESIMSKLLQQPHKHLQVSDNATLMRIFEGHRYLLDDFETLHLKFEQLRGILSDVQSRYEHIKHDLGEDLARHKAEIKRLELIIAKGQNGIAEVMHVRQDSIVRKHRYAWQQDAVDTKEGEESMLDFLDHLALSKDRDMSNQRGIETITYCGSPTDVFTAFMKVKPVGADEAFNEQSQSIHQHEQLRRAASTAPSPARENIRHLFTPQPGPASWSDRGGKKTPLLKKQSSGLFSRLRHQPSDSESPLRCFSFDHGDDMSPLTNRIPFAGSPALGQCKSYSSMRTPELRRLPTPLTLINSSGSTSSAGEAKRLSKIPSPVFPSGAMPRQQRKKSGSSSVTVLHGERS